MRAPGEVVDRYTIVTLLGQGGMGEVYEAEDGVLRRRVALKLIAPGSDEEARERMLREARLAAAFEHPNAVTVYDAGVVEKGTEKEQTYLAMELCAGCATPRGPSPPPTGRAWFTATSSRTT
jgi:eukaryotic-like serine/threonine-protein kinase